MSGMLGAVKVVGAWEGCSSSARYWGSGKMFLGLFLGC